MNEPFGRQPQLVTVTVNGEPADVSYWVMRLRSAAEFKGDITQEGNYGSFVIHPRAVNE